MQDAGGKAQEAARPTLPSGNGGADTLTPAPLPSRERDRSYLRLERQKPIARKISATHAMAKAAGRLFLTM